MNPLILMIIGILSVPDDDGGGDNDDLENDAIVPDGLGGLEVLAIAVLTIIVLLGGGYLLSVII